MNSRRITGALVGLALGFLFYLTYRSDHTVSNRLASELCGPQVFSALKQRLIHWLPLPAVLRACLPSALWCFIATALCGGWRFRLRGERHLRLVWVPSLFNSVWELIQWWGWTDGRADWFDVVAGVIGGLIAHELFSRSDKSTDEISTWWNWRVGVVAAGFACMGLADVWK